jgi:hypothetical protein
MNFIIQKLKNKHIFLKKLSNWAKLNSLILREQEETITKYFAPNFTLTKIWTGQDSLFVSFLGKKREKIWLGRDSNPRSVDQKLIVLTITPLVPCLKICKSIYITYIVMRQKVSLGLSKFLWVYCQSKVRINWL